MNEREMSWRILLIAGLLAVGVVAVYPIDQRIKFGIDLRGGYSLTYEIDDSGMENDPNRMHLAEDVMKILKERVDPNGVLNLVWRPIGHNRLEIQMPRPPAEVVKKRDNFIAARDSLINLAIRRGDVMLALTRKGAEREAAFAKLVGGVPRRSALLDALAKAYDAQMAAEEGNDAAAMDAAAKTYNDALKAVLATNVEIGRLETAINIDPRKPARQAEIERIKKDHADLSTQISSVVAAFDDWRAQRGKGEGSLDDPADLQRLLRGAGVLEFRMLVAPDPSDATIQQYVENLQKRGTRRTPEDRYGWFQIENPEYFFKRTTAELEKQFDTLKRGLCVAERFGDKYYLLGHLDASKTLAQDRGGANEWKLNSAFPTRDETGLPAVSFELDEAGGSRFQRLTSANIGKQLCFFLDGMAVSAANINSAIRTRGIIQGHFTPEEVQRLCQKLNAGSLPRKLKEPPISIQGVGPSLGEANRTAGQRAAMYGCLAVFLFMFIYYRYAGIVAIIALVLNILLTGAVISALNATMTLAGIAGLVLAIGMAVDANVLINERIREELSRGVTMRQAIKLGYEKAFSAILDSNLTTILTSMILYWLGSEEIKGFALTLGWGVIISLGTSVYVTRYFFEYMDAPRLSNAGVVVRPLLIAAGIAAVGALMWGERYWRLPAELHNQSVSMFLGRMFMYVLPATVLVLFLMSLMRGLHRVQQVRKPNSLPMMAMIGVPKINWWSKRHAFFTISLIASIGGMLVFFSRDSRGVYDIEFLGGTSVQIDLKPEAAATATQEVIERKLAAAKTDMEAIAAKVEAADVKQSGAEYIVTAPGVAWERLKNIVTARLRDNLPQGGVLESGENAVRIRLKDGAKIGGQDPTVDLIKRELAAAAARAREAGTDIADSQVQSVITSGVGRTGVYEIVTRETSRELVIDAILSQLKADLDIQPALNFKLREDAVRGGVPYFPVTNEDLGRSIGESTSMERVPEWVGGVAIVVEDLQPPQTIDSLKKRLRDMRLQPSNAAIGWRQQHVVGLTPAGESGGKPLYSRVALLTTDENYLYEEGGSYVAQWREDFAAPEVKLAREALERQTSLGKVSQFAPQVATEAKTKAYFAVALSWLMMIVYLWFRFGNWVWGLAAVVALVHDVTMALGLVAISYFLYKIPGLHEFLLIEPLRIDMAIVAAILTVIGYSVNDKIVIFDRIRENRGKGRDITPSLVNDSINQCMSRTFLTGGALIANIIIMYIWGGRGIHGFNFAMLIGCLVGTYSSFAIASPLLVLLRKRAVEPATV